MKIKFFVLIVAALLMAVPTLIILDYVDKKRSQYRDQNEGRYIELASAEILSQWGCTDKGQQEEFFLRLMNRFDPVAKTIIAQKKILSEKENAGTITVAERNDLYSVPYTLDKVSSVPYTGESVQKTYDNFSERLKRNLQMQNGQPFFTEPSCRVNTDLNHPASDCGSPVFSVRRKYVSSSSDELGAIEAVYENSHVRWVMDKGAIRMEWEAMSPSIRTRELRRLEVDADIRQQATAQAEREVGELNVKQVGNEPNRRALVDATYRKHVCNLTRS